ncbi:Na+/H+ antiporter NhaC family protein [Clostridium sp. 001]|uniref:Na+/H+ antiporter NhaC family protein n=1 Tax=Clostridium sp. 001 TaxID=1970093 RepID=UPI001C2C739A|nr:Na+/H+ antiporter NhaC family protein [Clostridium sp. 001]QXE20171.1 sodium:proton antiporter [Clostridium sp. 001]
MCNKNIKERHRYIVLIFTFMAILSSIVFKASLFYAFTISIIFSTCVFVKSGFSITELLVMVNNSLLDCRQLLTLILLIGALIPVWFSSGVIPTIMYYGFKYMQHMNILFTIFILTSAVAVFIGSAFATISTIGIASLGLAKAFGIPDYIILGVIVSGAFLADKMSPISGLVNLTLTTVKTSYKNMLSSMVKILFPAYLIAGSVYFYIGQRYSLGSNSSNINRYTTAIKKSFVISPLFLLIPAVIFIVSFLGVKIVNSLSLGLVASVILSMTVQKTSIWGVVMEITTGYVGNTKYEYLNKVLTGGGITSMVEVLLIMAGAISLNSIFQGTGLIKPIVDKVISTIKSKEELVIKTCAISGMSTIACDQTVGIILPGQLLRHKYEELGVENKILARTISDTGTVIAPLVPWNVNSLLILAVTGISTIKYAPYALLCYTLPIVTILAACICKVKKAG